jgi:hypothetical protein
MLAKESITDLLVSNLYGIVAQVPVSAPEPGTIFLLSQTTAVGHQEISIDSRKSLLDPLHSQVKVAG